MSDETEAVRVWCKGCGEEFVAFLQKMADRNAVVVCPKCGKANTPTDSLSSGNN
jgi:uncharacterized Zn finger protein